MYESAIYDWYLSSHWEAQLIHIPTFVFCYCNKTVTTFTTVKGFFPPNSCCKWFRPFRSGPTTKYMSQRWHTISCRACHYRSLGVAPHYQGCHDMPTQSMMHSMCGIVSDLNASVWFCPEMKTRYTSINHDVHTALYCGPCQLGYGGL
jgi:hypothetical protein